jgi:hypothetical protein
MAKTVVQSSSDYFVLSQTPVSNRPAVSDTSGIILFIDGNNNLRALYANPQNLQEQLIEGSGVWGSVAIGPGLNSFAITSKFIDTTIYYFDLLDSTKSNAFKIRTPAYDANNVSTALYADAMSFDLTGRYILFDTYNSVNGASGDITFWNINIIDISTGNIQSVFPPQQEGISIGNPSFSKTSQTRFTFDYWNTKQNQFAVYAADFNTGNLGLVDNTADLGYPTYSGDDNTIAYHTKFNINSVFHDVILQMPLQSDHITGTGTSKLYLADATYPVWFVIGERITDVKTTPVLIPQEFALQQNYPNPFNPSTIITYQLPIINYVTLKVYDVLGRVVKTLVNERQAAGMHSVTFNAAGLSSGIYFYRITCLPDRQAAGNFTDVKKLVLLK